jgi:hypothetical protein
MTSLRLFGYAIQSWTLRKSLTPLPNTRGAAVVGDVCYCVSRVWRHGNIQNATRILLQLTNCISGANDWWKVVCIYILHFFGCNHGGSFGESVSRIWRTLAELWLRAEVFLRTTDDAGWRWSEQVVPAKHVRHRLPRTCPPYPKWIFPECLTVADWGMYTLHLTVRVWATFILVPRTYDFANITHHLKVRVWAIFFSASYLRFRQYYSPS